MKRLVALLPLIARSLTTVPVAGAATLSSDKTSCGTLKPLRRSMIEKQFKIAKSGAEALAGQRKDNGLVAQIALAQVTQGFESTPSDNVYLTSFVAKAHTRTLLIQNAHNESKNGPVLGVRILELNDNGDLKPSVSELYSSGIFQPSHAPRGRCAKYNWKCVRDGCGAMAVPCGAASGSAYFACLGIACVFMLGVCCDKWEPNPYD